MRSPGRIILWLIGAFLALIVLSFFLFMCVLPIVGVAMNLPSISSSMDFSATPTPPAQR